MKTSLLGGGLGGAVAMALTVGPAAMGQELYLTYGYDSPMLVRFDGPTGKLLEEIPILGAHHLGRGLTVRWDGMLYITNNLGGFGNRYLFRIDPKTGQGESIGDPLPPDLQPLAADPNTGRLYGAALKELYEIDHKTGQATLIGTMENPELFVQVFSMAIGRDGYAYVTDYPDVSLLRVDLHTAETTFICNLGSMSWYEDIGFDADGRLWAAFELEGDVRRADIDTCAVDVLYSKGNIDGLEVVPGGPECYADCSGDEALDLFDFLCFINAFNAADERADCNGDEKFDLFDFLCFTNSFNAGC